MDKKALDKAVEEAHKKGYLEITLHIQLDAGFRKDAFMEELTGALNIAEKITKAYVEKYGKETAEKRYIENKP